MAKRLAKIIAMGVLIIMAIGLFAGCGEKISYNAVLYDDVSDWINAEFKAINGTSGIVAGDNDLPKSRVWLVSSQADYDDKIMGTPFNCDFDNQMLVIYSFTTEYVRTVKLTKVSKNDSVLNVEFEMVKPNDAVGSAVREYQRWLVIKLDKTEVASANVTEKK